MSEEQRKRLVEVTQAPVTKTQPLTPAERNAAHLTGSAFAAGSIISTYFGNAADPVHVLTQLRAQAQAVVDGDLSQVEGMLANQAVALQAMFMDLANRAKRQTSLQGTVALTQLALKAQSGSRATLQALADVKNPRQIAFVRQTNVAQNQQVNNGGAAPSRAKQIKESPNELFLENKNATSHLDRRATPASVTVDSKLGAMDKVQRPKKRLR